MTPDIVGLVELAERCEQASGPDRELDARIWCVVGVGSPWNAENCWLAATARPPEFESIGLTLPQWLDRWPEQAAAMADAYNVPRYTASLDAAMTLVPEDSWDHIEVYRPDFQTLCWSVHLLANGNFKDRQPSEGFGQSWPLALCAAALRARQALKTGEDER